jgi:DNA-damage-inducible protein D
MVPLDGQSPFDALRKTRPDGSEFWSARDLMPMLGYMKWERFADTVEQAKGVIATEAGADAADREASRFREAFGRTRQVGDNYELSRRACYLTAMRGDSRKPEIRTALLYFAQKTREAELRPVPREMTKLEALRAAIESEEGRIAAEARAVEAEQQVRALEPAARSWEVLASAEGDWSLRDAALILNRDPAISTGQNRLNNKLFELGMVDRRGTPYAKHHAHLTERPRTYKDWETNEERQAKPQIRITAAGLKYLHKRLGGQAPIQYDELRLDDAG